MNDDPSTTATDAPENPRTTRMRDSVLNAVVDLIVSEGAGAVTALRVSERACVARSTIYQHWPTSAALVRGAIDRIIVPNAPTPITGDVEVDLTATLSQLRERLEHRPFRIWLATLLDHAKDDPEFAEAQVRFVTGVLQPVRDTVVTALERGDLRSGLDVDEATTRLASPVLTEHVMLRRSADDAAIATSVRAFLSDHGTASHRST